MLKPFLALQVLSVIALCNSSSVRPKNQTSQKACAQEHNVWVGRALEQMESIKSGMTREELLKTFTTEGGLSTGLHRTFVSRDCAYFKVDVEFKPVGRPDRDGDGRVTLEEDPRDIIVKISRPYLQFSITD
jgi:hypothetical protein